MRKLSKGILALTTGLVAVAGAVASPSLVSAWGDNLGGRRSYTIDQINHGALGDKITFNSISDSVIGDEKNFVAARINDGDHGQNNVWSPNDITVQNGQEYIIRLYVHNNSPKGMDAVSKNTRVGISIPNVSSTKIQVNGHIYSDNASPSDYYDYVNFNSDRPFHLVYVAGSARLDNNGVGKDGGVQLSDNIVYKAASEHGVRIGYSSLDGELPGCYSYSGFVTIKVKVVYDDVQSNNGLTFSQQVRLVGSSEWSDSVDAKVGDKVEFWIQYRNTSSETQNDVMIRDVLPQSLRYVTGTTKLWNDHLNGAVNNENTIATTGINIGHYGPNANAHVRFQAEVVEDGLANGSNALFNWAQISTGSKLSQNYNIVYTQKAGTDDPVIPQGKQYHVKVNYIFADGTTAAASYDGLFEEGDSYRIESPEISGYLPDAALVTGKVGNKDVEINVTYVKANDSTNDYNEPDQQPSGNTPDDSQTDNKFPNDQPATSMPNTGPATVVGGLMATGSLSTAAGYYVSSRRALKRR